MLPDTIRKEFAAIHEISAFIHRNPELGYKEFKAAAALKKFLSGRGFTIRENLGGVETAFLAECDSPGAGPEIPLFGFLAEYDALAGLGHACGHNLIAAAALAALLETRARLDRAGIAYRLCCIGTPAEETLGGKVKMIEGGAFEGVAASIEGHPFHKTMPDPGCLSVARCTVSFYGKASHAAIAPEKGINALDAICEFICAIRKWRPRIGARERVHGIITKGGDAPNIIPEYTEAFYYVRAPGEQAIIPLKKHLEELAQAAAAETDRMDEHLSVVGVVEEDSPDLRSGCGLDNASGECGVEGQQVRSGLRDVPVVLSDFHLALRVGEVDALGRGFVGGGVGRRKFVCVFGGSLCGVCFVGGQRAVYDQELL